MKPTSVFLGTRLLAQGFCGEQWWNAVMLCSRCGEVWGRIDRGGEWKACHALCPKHGGGSFLIDLLWPGSSGCLETPWEQGKKFLRANPELLKWEFKLAMERSGL